ncbi:hypothetical protein LCGC14_3167510, partial [marine sediment metagenome]
KGAYVLAFNGSSAQEIGLWLLKTSRNDKKRKELREKMYVIQEYNKKNTWKRYRS